MKFDNVEIHDELIDAQKKNELVIFAGAGVSSGYPAYMPSFRTLLEMAVEDFNPEPFGLLPVDGGRLNIPQAFSRLEKLLYPREKLLKEYVKSTYSKTTKTTKLHRCLVRLFSSDQAVRIVTTNYDLLISQEVKTVKKVEPEEQQYPDLAIEDGELFKGVAYLHGSVSGNAENLVLTKTDFSRAYFGERPIARTFLERVLNKGCLMFIGYSLLDPIIDYLIEGRGDRQRMFSLCRNQECLRWEDAGVNAVIYPTYDDGDEYRHLDEAMRQWAEKVQQTTIVFDDL